MVTNKRAVEPPPAAEGDAHELTPAEIRGVLLELARRQTDERAARPAIAALNRLLRDSLRLPPTRPAE